MKTVTVDAVALGRVLKAILGPEHHIRELKVIYDLHKLIPGELESDPIGLLLYQYTKHLTEYNKEESPDEAS